METSSKKCLLPLVQRNRSGQLSGELLLIWKTVVCVEGKLWTCALNAVVWKCCSSNWQTRKWICCLIWLNPNSFSYLLLIVSVWGAAKLGEHGKWRSGRAGGIQWRHYCWCHGIWSVKVLAWKLLIVKCFANVIFNVFAYKFASDAFFSRVNTAFVSSSLCSL